MNQNVVRNANAHFKRKEYKEAYELYKLASQIYGDALFEFNLKVCEKNILNHGHDAQAVETNVVNVQAHKAPKLSIVMPVFNVGPYLDASILSVLHQSFSDFELIIVNDASTDEGLSIIEMYSKLDSRIKVINLDYNTLGGAGIPSNIGIEHAEGKYVGFVDSDDFIVKDAFEKLISEAEKNEADLVIADFRIFENERRNVKVAYDKKEWNGLPLAAAFSPEDYPAIFRLSPVPWRKLYRLDFLNQSNIRFPEGDYFYEDNPLHWTVLSQAKKVVLIDFAVSYHRMGRPGQTMGADTYKLAAHFCHLNTIKNYFLSHGSSVSATVWKELIKRSMSVDWIVKDEVEADIIKILKKRNVITIKEILRSSKLSSGDISEYFPTLDKKIDDFDNLRKDVDLTIIIPVYNCDDLLGDNLERLTAFNKINVEIFLMDDGSTDSSKSVCEHYAAHYDNVYLFSQKNKGAGVARNALIPLATGEYTFFLDADDTVDVTALEEAVLLSQSNSYDLTLFKYQMHFYEKNTFKKMFDSDAKIWESLLKAETNKEKKIISSRLINYPWIRVIKTSLLHNENMFFGKTVVHNDIPYHWHSIVAANKIGLFDKVVCTHRKFDTRSQITNINDSRRMMVFEAQRHTQHILLKYDGIQNIFPEWEKFIKNLLEWAKEKIPKDLSPSYLTKQSNTLLSMGAAYRELKKKQEREVKIGFYRIIASNIGDLHSSNQLIDNLKHIVEYESDCIGFEKIFILNRIRDLDERSEIISYLESRNITYLEIQFEVKDFKKIGFDFLSMPNSNYWFEKKGNWQKIVTNTAVRNFKNAYLMNNNGARNFALMHGKQNYDWIMPWDGNCFLSDLYFQELSNIFNAKDTYKYVVTPMERAVDNSTVTAKSKMVNAVEEPQISFRSDSIELFNENRVYGNQSKVELFKRLDIEGVWDEKINLYPWRKIEYSKSKEAGLHIKSEGVFRLYSGNSNAVACGKNRSHMRSYGIIDEIDNAEKDYVQINLKHFNLHEEAMRFLEKLNHIANFKASDDGSLTISDKDFNQINSQTKLLILLSAIANNKINEKSIVTIDFSKFNYKQGVNLYDTHIFTGTFNNLLSKLLLLLALNRVSEAIKVKLDISMLLYFYFDKEKKLTYKINAYLNEIIIFINLIFKKVFEYDFPENLKSANIVIKNFNEKT